MISNSTPQPQLSVIVICFNMRREAARTLYTLSQQYQRNVAASDYEVIVIDNNSSAPLTEQEVAAFGVNFNYFYHQTDSVSPAAAVNLGAQYAKGEIIACIVDGARMVTPGKIRKTINACNDFAKPFSYSLARHIGSINQNEALLEGYNQTVEDALFETIDWKKDGYQLLNISCIAQSSENALLHGELPPECSFFAMHKRSFIEMGGYDERFQMPGGGLVNHDFLNRIVESEKFTYIQLAGEASFHQFHGGVATNVVMQEHPIEQFKAEYQSIHGIGYKVPEQIDVIYYD